MPKFFTDRSNINDATLSLKGGDVAHITRVLRMKVGDSINVCDGSGTDYTATISSMSKDEIMADITEKHPCEAEPKVKVTVFQALPKQGKMEYIIQKNTELGVFKIVPVYTSRCVVKPTDKRDRWQKVAAEAAKQCGRGIIPEVTDTIPFKEALEQLRDYPVKLMLYECEDKTTLHGLLSQPIQEIAVLVGPEGGFDISEVDAAKKMGINTVTLGKRILRTETAAAAVLPIIMYEQNEI